jgi:hypothetical protein
MGVSGQSHAPAALYPRGKYPRYPLAGWSPGLVWTQRLEEKSFPSAGDRIPVVQFVACNQVTEIIKNNRLIFFF